MKSIPQERSAEVRISKLIRAPKAEVFAWCTDYSDLDPEIMGSKGSQTRRIISRDKERIVFVDTYSDPAIEWRAGFTGGRWEGTGIYTLSETRNGTTLDIVFRMEKAIEGYTAEDLKQRANETWDKYVNAIEKSTQSTR